MSWNTRTIEFACQRCLQPLIFNDFTLNEYEQAELARKNPKYFIQ